MYWPEPEFTYTIYARNYNMLAWVNEVEVFVSKSIFGILCLCGTQYHSMNFLNNCKKGKS